MIEALRWKYELWESFRPAVDSYAGSTNRTLSQRVISIRLCAQVVIGGGGNNLIIYDSNQAANMGNDGGR